MVAPFWSDVDTGNVNNPIGDVFMRLFDGDGDGNDDTRLDEVTPFFTNGVIDLQPDD